jgi:hypothetical protein
LSPTRSSSLRPPRWWTAFWGSPARLGFASAALLSAAILVLGSRTGRPRFSVQARLGEILIARGKIDAEDLERALELQRERGDKLGKILVDMG